jgi:hypothetical protein
MVFLDVGDGSSELSAVVLLSAVDSPSFFIADVSLFRMRRDLPSARAVSGSRFAPKTRTTRATMRTICHGPIWPIISVFSLIRDCMDLLSVPESGDQVVPHAMQS